MHRPLRRRWRSQRSRATARWCSWPNKYIDHVSGSQAEAENISILINAIGYADRHGFVHEVLYAVTIAENCHLGLSLVWLFYGSAVRLRG